MANATAAHASPGFPRGFTGSDGRDPGAHDLPNRQQACRTARSHASYSVHVYLPFLC
jgi:hypothetical protein